MLERKWNRFVKYGAVIIGLLAIPFQAFANEEAGRGAAESKEIVRAALRNILEDNNKFVHRHNTQCFDPFLKSQTPRVTLVGCSDSRVHTYALDATPDNDLFVIRNIGNQIRSTEGSVEYGVHHLHTPLLLILGHTGCGAVKAALGTKEGLSPAIRREVDPIKLSAKNLSEIGEEIWLRSVEENVNQQVAYAKKKFAREIREGSLVVVGAIYDLHNTRGKGNGHVAIINMNGETDRRKIEKLSPFSELAGAEEE